jgi:hypothetical protein
MWSEAEPVFHFTTGGLSTHKQSHYSCLPVACITGESHISRQRATYPGREPHLPAESHISRQRAKSPGREPHLPAESHISRQRATSPGREPHLPAESHISRQRATYPGREPHLPAESHISRQRATSPGKHKKNISILIKSRIFCIIQLIFVIISIANRHKNEPNHVKIRQYTVFLRNVCKQSIYVSETHVAVHIEAPYLAPDPHII